MIGADSQPGRQQQRGKMHVAQPKWRQFSVEDGGLLEIVFFAIKVPFVGSQFLTDFNSQKRCLYSKRSHGPLLRAFCLCFYFKQVILRLLSRPSSCLTVTCLSATCVAVLTSQLCCAHPSSCLTCLSAACVGVLTSQLCCAHPSSCLTCLCHLYCSVDQSVVLCSPIVLPDMCRLCWKCWSVLLVLTWPSTNLQVLTSSPCWRRDAACLALLLTLSASLVGDAELCSALPHIGCTTLWTEERFSNLTQHCARSVGNNGTAMRVTKSITFVKVLIVLT